jgi:DeoR/GlpR family transcriptional regulator of sugar metabolism
VSPEQRREAIARLLEDCPEASQRAIADAIGCSEATVARDMAKLSLADRRSSSTDPDNPPT